MKDSIWLMLLLQVILIALNAIFASAEIAVISMNDNKLAKMAAAGDKRAVRLARLTSQPARFLSTIQVAITLSGFLGSAFAADNFSGRLVALIMKTGIPVSEKTLNTLAVILITLLLSYFTLIFGELVPKRMAMRRAEALALRLSSAIYVISKLFAPIVSLLTVSTNLSLRALGIDPNEADDHVSEEDILMMVDAGNEKGAIDNTEKELIQNVFEFDDLTAGEIATHRTDVDMLWMDETPEKWKQTIHESRHTRFPVCDESVDNIVGVLNAKDYFRIEENDRDRIMELAVKQPYFVPEGVKADVLFKNMQKTHNQFAVVLDEYGGMTGIVTMSDLIEQLVGEINYEEDVEEEQRPDIEQIDEKTWRIRGSAELDEVEKTIGVLLPEGDYDTFNGYVLSALGSIPDDGSEVDLETDGLSIKITEVLEHQIETSIVCLTGEKNDSKKASDEEESNK